MRKRNKLTLLLAMPIAVVLWGVGWVFSLTGANRKKPIKAKKALP